MKTISELLKEILKRTPVYMHDKVLKYGELMYAEGFKAGKSSKKDMKEIK